ncbi:hypothetical protein [Streptomyces lavendulae]|uniref:hypothetical protein n=1 Tax=Streptomyces lavendulae TaxID=1914 RepID=UPI00255591B6|nr:hypothetical protein [Streptomyces lavendulae]
MPGSDKPESDGTEDEGAPRVRGESSCTVRNLLLVGVAQGVLADLAGEVGHRIFQWLVWLYGLIVSYL